MSKFDSVNWKEIGTKLAAHAVWKARQGHYWRVDRGGILARGQEAKDVAAEAITQAIRGERTGKRKWDPKRGPLLQHLKLVVNSLMSNLSTCHDNTRRGSVIEDADGEGMDRVEYAAIEARDHDFSDLVPRGWDPEKLIAGSEELKKLEDAVRQSGNTSAIATLRHIVRVGDVVPKDIASSREVPLHQVYRDLERIRAMRSDD